MFSFKKIGITLGILGVFGLTGARMGDSVFAEPGHGKGKGGPAAAEDVKVTICHYEPEYTLVVEGEDDVIVAAEWAMIDVDMASEEDHMTEHQYDGGNDFLISFATDNPEGVGPEHEDYNADLSLFGVNDSAADCVALLPVEPAEDEDGD